MKLHKKMWIFIDTKIKTPQLKIHVFLAIINYF